MSRVVVHKRAAKYLQRLPAPQKEQIKTIIRQIGDDPLTYPGVKAMAGEWAGYYRVRVGKLRIIFWFEQAEDTVYIDHIGPRGDIYK